MKTLTCFVLLVTYRVTMTYSQQCRQVTSTVCDDDVTNVSRQKGDKGEIGSPGKSGSQGIKGSKGDSGGVGEKGAQGESCALGSFGNDIINRLAYLEDFFRPDSCTNALLDGNQFLRNGLKVYCEDRWTPQLTSPCEHRWTIRSYIFQRRFDGSVNFQRTWDEYKLGFGNSEGEFWLGLEAVHRLTRRGKCDLRVELQNFDDNHYWAKYSTFSVDSEADLYRLYVGGYTGNATDRLEYHNNQPFTTMDRDNDAFGRNCASEHDGEAGGWWYKSCYYSQLNGFWGENGRSIYWTSGPRPKVTAMKFRCD
ncbi:microfibril-associated glycoprotein 4-like isoform X2 [Clavelina lepadiformis]|uniref:microfibril-associated glycoprotein 4-like isoform X2 n=1 Tax=Clavelina lepadiformis TaxID=159417 RepID=UPI0040428906